MVHYIRFLRTPQTQAGKKTVDIAAVVAVTTDLGDAYYSQDVDLAVEVVEANRPHGILHSEVVHWQASSRALRFTVNCPGKYASRPARLHVTTHETTAASTSSAVPRILDVWSDAFVLADKQRAEPIVERQLLLPNKRLLRMWEETGDSIARHVWDAGLGFLMYFSQALFSVPVEGMSQTAALLKTSKVRRLKVLELGAGCGTVGIALAQLVKCDMLLTDLDDSQEILASNIRCASPLAGSTIQSQVLDWSTGVDDSTNANYDLVLVSDCIYNPDSSLHLVETLRQLATRTPDVLILVGFKRRHEADTIFFDRMQQTSFVIVEQMNIPLPHTVTEYDADIPTSEFYTYRLQSA
ncbi:hypothetical protein HRR83_007054 [Exophiala dermatitidis]|uniref:Methyltransferase-domain-containing protein n=1 Tax=Exophiala dermatitidis TaxID=5970 RepID=A0AAN6ERQ2_EXODE|nr:hypothetical protein HRR75_005757 [Exophiala dermatitidis]KAJ4512538.1 hypothetical protein HRR73_006093 [Exophiala dermatitidis]KAJ4512588.1 hypothetical protein HRR74_006286 [Exophiala dermatitidis]KAJ4542383.1 hypothetical protein HRR77_005590 [Exophiala dermatitidis]KAJ4546676.1 hypothetical protein HRR78_005677 [Exophiala dermatitidis]